MKNKFLEMAGVATEEEFYNMFPSEEAFFEAYPQARQMKKGGNVPTNPQLYSRVKSEAKQKFDRWPSAYGSAWLVKTYKQRGGGYRKAQMGMEMNPDANVQEYGQNILDYANSMTPTMIPMIPNNQGGKSNNNSGMMDFAMQMLPAIMAAGGKMPQWLAEKRFKAAGREDQLDNYGYMYGGDTNMMYGGKYMQNGGEPDGEMAMGQLMSIMEKAEKLKQFINQDTDLEPWVSSKITMADDYIDSISDYMMYSEDEGRDLEVEEEDEEYSMGEMEEMKMGGIPQRYKNKGFTKVGVKRQSTRPGKKWMVLAKKGDKYKVVHGGYKGMKDFSQHGSSKRKERFWDRMGGKDSAKANDPFSPLYWHKRFGTWQEGGELPVMENMMESYNPYEIMKKGGIFIKPENRGKFTAQAKAAGMGVQEFAGKVLSNKEDYSSTTVKRANFARNAAGWKKQMGGGINMGDTMELDEAEIQRLMDMGYGVEYID
jgi:hypothetical protein